ncbi:flotillin family protein [Methylibium sp.]|uniref:flotillin family protein n=1 Tax=Methylibium sp. TaxID=2067992 RepID=UPI003D0CD652
MQVNFGAVILGIVVLIVAIAILWWIMSKLYQRSTTERAFVRTGFMGQRVAISGGALVVPVLHELTWVNMSTLRISLSHHNENALITHDRLRLNVDADFYVRVKADAASVAAAARSLGSKTASVEAMRQLLEARFNDALRTAAAEASMEGLHENRSAYSTRVRQLASAGIDGSGLEIDSVSISKLDQASREFFNPNNAFDAAGLTILTAEIEERRKRRNEIERDSQVAIQRKNLAAEQQMLELQKEEEYARLQQEREIAVRRAQQQSEIAVETQEMQRLSKVAEVNATEAVEKARLDSDRTLREQKLRLEQQVQEIEVGRTRAIGIAENERRGALELAQQQTEIAIAEHSKRRNVALAEAQASRADAVRAEESVISARELERAEREKALFLLAAAKDIEAKGLAVLKQAATEREAAGKRAETMQLLSQAEADADKLRQLSAKLRHDVEAGGRRALNEAENVMSPDAMALRAKLAAIERMEAVVRESAKPLERISDIKIVHVDGLAGLSGGADGQAANASVSDQVMHSALKYKLQAPLVNALLASAGLDLHDASRVLKS